MSRHLERLLELDRLIRSSDRHTASTLAEALEVSERTVRNDLDFLRDRYNAPIESDRIKGYYYSDSNWRLDSIPLTKGELFALTLGARMLQSYSGSAYEPELKSAIEQLSRRIPEQTWVDLNGLAGDRVMIREGAELNLDPDIWHKLETACQQKRSIKMSYYTEIDPTFDAKEHFAMAFQHEVGGIPTQISIWFDAATAPFIRERRWHPTQQLDENSDGSLVLNFVARGLNEVKRWILFYGKGAKAIAPPELVEMVREEVTLLYRNYGEI